MLPGWHAAVVARPFVAERLRGAKDNRWLRQDPSRIFANNRGGVRGIY
jgi:hypothetical protein